MGYGRVTYIAIVAVLAAVGLHVVVALAGLPAPLGVTASGVPPVGDRANAVVSGAFTAVGPSQPFAFAGPLDVSIYGSLNSALTTSGGSLSASVASGTGIAAGTAINSALVPPGTTWATFSGTSGTLALPTITLAADTSMAAPIMRGLRVTAGLLGATVSGPGIPAGTTVTAILLPAQPNSDNVPQQTTTTPLPFGQIQISNTPTSVKLTTGPAMFSFTLAAAAVTGGTDAAAIFTGSGITYAGSVQLERSFDGGATWLVANAGGAGLMAIYSTGTPINLAFGEPELQVLYRLNCTAFTAPNPINYRLSETGGAATSLSLGSPI